MGNDTLIIIEYGIGALLCIIAGFFALKIGKDLYMSGAGISEEGSSIEVKGVKAQMKTVGSVVMLTSVAWGFLGMQIFPDYKRNKDGIILGSPTPKMVSSNDFTSEKFTQLKSMYLEGVQKDSASTFKTWKVLAEHEVPQAKAIISYAYKNGVGVKKNIDSSKFWNRKLQEKKANQFKEKDKKETSESVPQNRKSN